MYALEKMSQRKRHEQVLALLRSFGIASVVPERLMDVVVGVSGSSPAYVFMFIEAMADEAVAAGMPRKQAYEFAHSPYSAVPEWCWRPANIPGVERYGMFSRWYHDPGSQSTRRERHACRCDGCHGRLHREVEMYVVTAQLMSKGSHAVTKSVITRLCEWRKPSCHG